MSRLRVSVKLSDIDRGKPTYPAECALALALYRTTGSRPCSVGRQFAQILEDDGNVTVWELSRRAQEFIRAFDDMRSVYASTFILRRVE